MSVSVGSSVTSGARCGGWCGGPGGGGVSGTPRRVVIATERSLITVVIAAHVTVIAARRE